MRVFLSLIKDLTAETQRRKLIYINFSEKLTPNHLEKLSSSKIEIQKSMRLCVEKKHGRN